LYYFIITNSGSITSSAMFSQFSGPPVVHFTMMEPQSPVVGDSTDNPEILDKASMPMLPPTDVGLIAWLQVLGGFFLMFNSFGIVVSYGVFQTFYTSGGITDQSSPSTIAWIGSIQVFLLLFGGAIGGKYFDAGYFRHMLCIGTFLVVFGLMMTSISTKYYQFMLAQGVCVGAGISMFLVPSVGLPGTWFDKRRGMAVGIVTTGSSTAGVIYPIMLHKLVPEIGFPWATRVLGFVALGTLMIPLIVMRQRLPPRKRGSVIEYQALRTPEFALYVIGIFFTFLGFFTFYNFVEEWTLATHMDTKGLNVFYILPIVNAASAFGRVIPNYISDYIGRLNVQTPAVAMAGILVLLWLPVNEIGALMTIAILYGFFSGALLGLPPAAVASMTPDLSSFGGRLGVVFVAMSISSLIGSPVTGAIVQASNGSYDGARIWGGVTMIVGAIVLLFARMVKAKWVIWEIA
jgi:MFS family permease